MKKRWWFLLLVAAVLAVLGLTWGSWLGVLLGILDQEGARIRTLNALGALIVLVVGFAGAAWAYFHRRHREQGSASSADGQSQTGEREDPDPAPIGSAAPSEPPLPPQLPSIQADGGSVAIGGKAHHNVIVTGRGHVVGSTVNVFGGSEESRPAPAGPAAGDLAEARAGYLGYLRDRYRYLDLKGMGVADRVPLRLPLLELFVPLLARPELPEGETWDREALMAGRRLSEEAAERLGRRLSEPRRVLELVREHQGLVILGDPGSGKTTFLKYLAVTLAEGRPGDLELGDRLPVLVPLSAYATALAERDTRLDEFVREYVFHLGARPQPQVRQVLSDSLEQGRALLLLDGLDEVRKTALRQTVVQRVADFFSFHRAAGNKFVITSRIVGYKEVRAVAEGLAECTLVDFDDEKIALFVERWTAAIERQAKGATAVAATDAEEERSELEAAIRGNAGVRRLAANPLLLTILALMKRQGVRLPERRVELYDRYVETLLSSWNRARGLGRPPQRDLDVLETVSILAPLAKWMREVDPGLGLVRREALIGRLTEVYEERGEADARGRARRFLADVREHAGLLLERGAGEYGFIHLTFEEYLAAAAVAQDGQGDPARMAAELARHLDEPAWREVSLLLVGYVGLIQRLAAVAGRILEHLVAGPGAPGPAVVLAGEALLDAGPAGVAAGSRGRVVDALVETMQSAAVPNALRREAGLLLGHLGWAPEDLDVFVEVPAGPFLYGEGREERRIEKPFWIGRYPVTNLQYARFVAGGGYARREYWSEEGWKWRVEKERTAPDSLRQELENPIFPRVDVTLHEAEAYCRWLGATAESFEIGEPGRREGAARFRARLPAEEEWERAARGADGREYPWGGAFEAWRANVAEKEFEKYIATTAVCTYPQGASPAGAWDTSGNVLEWTRSEKEGSTVPVPGGCYYLEARSARCATRFREFAVDFINLVGFRVVLSLADSES